MADKRPQIQATGMDADTWYAASSYDAEEAAKAASSSSTNSDEGRTDGYDSSDGTGLPYSRDVYNWPPHRWIPVTTVYYDLTTGGPSFWKDSDSDSENGSGDGAESGSDETQTDANETQTDASDASETQSGHTNVSGCQLPGHGVSTNSVRTGYGHSGTLKARISSTNSIKGAVSGANPYDSQSGSTATGLSGMLDTSKYTADGVSLLLDKRQFSLFGFADAEYGDVPCKGEDGKLAWVSDPDEIPWLGLYFTELEARLQTQFASGGSEEALAKLDDLVSVLYAPLIERVDGLETAITGFADSAEFTALAGRVTALENKPDDTPALQVLAQAVAGLSTAVEGKADSADVTEALLGKADAEATAAALEALSRRLDEAGSYTDEDLARLSATVSEHTDQIQALNTVISMGGSTAVQQLTTRVTNLETANTQTGSRLNSLDSDVNRLEDQFAALSGSVGSVLESVNAVNAEAREAKEEARALIAKASQGEEAYELARFSAERLFDIEVSSDYAKFGDLPAVDTSDAAVVAEAERTVYTLENGTAYIFDAVREEYALFDPAGDTIVFSCGDASTGD